MADLWTSLKIKGVYLTNRLVMPPMALDIAGESGEVTPQILRHYSERAKTSDSHKISAKGLGLIIVEHCYVSKAGKAHPRQLGIYDDKLIPGLTQLAEEIHGSGVAAGIQLSHAGARGFDYLVGPSAIPVPFLKRFSGADSLDKSYGRPVEIPEPMSKRDIQMLVDDFAFGATCAKTAGFDLVEIHGAHGYLLNQFFSPLTNHRNDAYGGSIMNRLRLSLEVLEAVRSAVGPNYPIFYRHGADDRIPGGYGIEDGARAAEFLEKAGVDCLDLSGGIGGYLRIGPEGYFCYMAEAIKEVTSVPILLTGGIKRASFANRIISEGHADLIGVGRAMLTDPDWISKAWEESCG